MIERVSLKVSRIARLGADQVVNVGIAFIARAQGLARAAGPFTVAAASGWVGSDAVFVALSAALLACCPLAYTLSRHPGLLPHSGA